MKNEKGRLIVISGPSGVGKSTVISRLMAKRDDFMFSISATTRAPRDGEQDGVNYYFISRDRFQEMIQADEFLEYAKALTKDTDGDGVIDQYGYAWPVQAENASDYWVQFMQMCGADISTYDEGKWESRLSDETAIKGTQLMVDLVQTHKVTPDSVVDYDWEAVTNAFVSG